MLPVAVMMVVAKEEREKMVTKRNTNIFSVSIAVM